MLLKYFFIKHLHKLEKYCFILMDCAHSMAHIPTKNILMTCVMVCTFFSNIKMRMNQEAIAKYFGKNKLLNDKLFSK